jgi:hypothetical protein
MSVSGPPPVKGDGPPAFLGTPSLLQEAALVYIRRGGGLSLWRLSMKAPIGWSKGFPRTFVWTTEAGWRLFTDRLKPHLGSSGVIPAAPLKRGYPGLPFHVPAGGSWLEAKDIAVASRS